MKGFYFVCVVSLWALPRGAAAVTPAQSNDLGDRSAGEVSSTSLNPAVRHLHTVRPSPSLTSTVVTTQAKSFSGPSTEMTLTPPLTPADNHLKTTTSDTISGPLEVSAATTNSQTSLRKQSTDIRTGPAPTAAVQPQSNNSEEMRSTRVPFKGTQSPTTTVTTQAESFSTEATSETPPSGIPSRGPSTEMTSTPLTPTDRPLRSPSDEPFVSTSTAGFGSSAGVTTPTTRFSTRGTHATPVENNSTAAGTVTAGGTVGGSTRSSGATQGTPVATTKKTIPITTSAKKKITIKIVPKPDHRTKPGGHHGTVVAVVIGGALVGMLLGFLVIYIKKRKTQKQQMESKEWAGPSPFLDGGVDNNGQVELRASSRVSLASFLPHRLSKRLSLLQETDEELREIVPGTTFGDHNPESTFGKEVVGEEVTGSDRAAAVIQQETQTQEDPSPVTPPQSDVPLPADDPAPEPPVAPSEDVDLVQDGLATNPPPPDALEDVIPLPQLDDDQSQTLDESSPPSSGSAEHLIPPAPPLADFMQQQQQ